MRADRKGSTIGSKGRVREDDLGKQVWFLSEHVVDLPLVRAGTEGEGRRLGPGGHR